STSGPSPPGAIRPERSAGRSPRTSCGRGGVDLQRVRADEPWVGRGGRRARMAGAMAAPSRLWLGGALRPRRDPTPVRTLVRVVRPRALSAAVRACVDGLASYVAAFRRVPRDPVRTGGTGRPRRRAAPGLLPGRVIKHQGGRRAAGATRRVVRGT